jgi:3-hydroxyisobutyrate dehydrogenase-like beta-hydroxyacid dehydrogenase
MGASIGAALRAQGTPVLWLSRGRSPATRARAEAARLTETTSLTVLLQASSVVLSICPPEAAQQVATEVASRHFQGVYVDANAVSPQSVLRMAALIEGEGADFVDGGIIGSPAEPGGDTRLYLAGVRASPVAALFQGSNRLSTTVLDAPLGAASALKVCFAAWTKGSTALLLAVRAAAVKLGVEGPLLDQWDSSHPELAERFAGTVRSSPRKAWRFVAEMDQIAQSFEAVEVTGAFHRAAADVYSRLSGFRDQMPGPDLDEVLSALAGQQSSSPSEREKVADAD